ncbi:MAG: hypothetical protein LBD29_01075 [Treponema sp.]|jgi:hypothetical protein|nr:hypothetical protein [Treponema sp.]
MPENHDYIPRNDRVLLSFAKTLYAYALANYARWGVPIPQTMLEADINAFDAALAVFQQPNHGMVDTLTKNEPRTH